MTTYRDIVTDVSTYLVDQERNFEFTHWSEAELKTYLQDAIRVVAMNAREFFVRESTVQLSPGTRQVLGEGCSLSSVVGLVDKYGNVKAPMRRTSHRAATTLARPVCAASGPYTPRTYSIDTADARSFYVQPPVPQDGSYELQVNCYAAPSVDSLDQAAEVPGDLVPIIKEFMLYYAYTQDTESVPAREFGATHWQNGVTLLAAYVSRPALAKVMAQMPHEVPA